MKKRRVLTLLALTVLTLSLLTLIPAQTAYEQPIENSYLWLINQVDGKWATIDTQNTALSLLALGYDDRLAVDGKNELLLKKNAAKDCWPSRSCKSKDTAFAALALNAVGEPVDDIIDWLLERETPFKVGGITWLLQIDSTGGSNCTIGYDNKEYNLGINEDKTYEWIDSGPSCLALTDANYWIKISSGCLDKAYSVSCENPAVISIPYRLGSTLYIPAETFFSPADVAIETFCIREGASCSYEATMWTSYLLQQTGREYTRYLPYLIGEARSNKKYIPDAMLFVLTGKEEHTVSLLDEQNRQGFWTDVGGNGKYWDTALGIFSIFDYAPENSTKAKDWLLDNQNNDGSFGTTKKIRDTAFVLQSVWPKLIRGGINDCEDVYRNFCRTSCFEGEEQVSISCAIGVCCKSDTTGCNELADCSKSECKGEFVTDIFGRRGQCESQESICDDNFDNDNDGLIDTDDPDCSVFCLDIGGQECDFDEDCDVPLRKTLETDRCCTGTCGSAQLSCSSQSGTFCDIDKQKCDGLIVSANDATSSSFCCQGTCKSKAKIWPWIIIILLILGGAGYYSNKKGYLDKPIAQLKKLFAKIFKKKPRKLETPYRPPVRPYERPTPTIPAGPLAYRHPYTRPQSQRPQRESRSESELKRIINRLKGYVAGK